MRGRHFYHEGKRSIKSGWPKTVGLTIYKPEDQVFQRLHLCEYLRELYEAAEEENEHGAEEKKDFQPYAQMECG